MSARKKNNAVNTVLYVPNDAEGQRFIALLRTYLNRDHYKIRLRGRNPNRKAIARREGLSRLSVRQSIKNGHSTKFAVYFDGKTTDKYPTERLRWFWKRIADLQTAVESQARQIEYLTQVKQPRQPAAPPPAAIAKILRKFRFDEL